MNRLYAIPTPTTTAETDPLWVLPLAQLQNQPRALIGGKALSWAELHRLGGRVPDGFCITTRAFGSRQSDGESAILPPNLELCLLEAFNRLRALHPDSRFAVRSSAVEEDDREASWAGVFDSYLDIRGADQFLEAVTRCFDSINAPRARLYRGEQSAEKTAAMAVMVQVQIEADAAGILFTRNPMQGSDERLCINAVRGLGAPLAAGEVEGDHYWLDTAHRVVEQRLHQARPVLDDAQLEELSRQARRLEAGLQPGLDLEFAYRDQELWWLQARAIPAPGEADRLETRIDRYLQGEQVRLKSRLSDLQDQGILLAGPGVLSNGNIGELLPSPTPMSFALFRTIFAGPGGAIARGRRVLGYQTDERTCAELFELVGGQPYFHLELDARTYDQDRPQPVAAYIAAVSADPHLANYPEFGLYQQFLAAGDADHQRAGTCARFQQRMRGHANLYLRHYRSWVEEYLRSYLEEERALDLARLNESQLVIQINRWITHLRRLSCCHFVIAARLGFYFAESLRFQLTELMGEGAEPLIANLLQALPGSRINQQCFDLEALRSGEVSRALYLKRYGHLATNELEISTPRLQESPELVEQLSATTDRKELAAFEALMRQRKAAEAELRLQLEGTDSERRRKVWGDYRLARRFLPLRETIKYYYTGEYALIRTALLEFAQRIGMEAKEVFYLEPKELPLCLKDPRPIRNRIHQRQETHRLVQQIARHRPLPNVIFGESPDLKGRPGNQGSGGEDLHQGHPVSPGLRRGRIRLLAHRQDDLQTLMDSLDADDIIVTHSANLGLAPLLRKVAGLIIEVGGFLAHGACQAREAGIPAMVLPDATLLLKENLEVWIDGSEGTLRMVDGNTV